jgi:hypothetical protein
MVGGRAEHGIAKVRDRCYVFGGRLGNGPSAETYSITDNTWADIKYMDNTPGTTTCAELNKLVYISGHNNSHLVIYDPLKNSYTDLNTIEEASVS